MIHLVGIINEKGDQTFDRMHREATENVLAAAKAAGVRRYLHMSAMGSSEDSPSQYGRTKAAGEKAVRASGLDWTIFRPSIVFGPGDGFVSLPLSFTGGEAFALVQTSWSFPSVDSATLQSFSGRTCNGCHVFVPTDPAQPTGTGPFFHVSPTTAPDATGQNLLSPFVKSIEIPRRASFMTNWLTCNAGSAPCGSGVDVALTQF